jgi:hypothetical protein
MTSTLIPVRGTRFYEAGTAMAAGRLQPGTKLRLVPCPDNPYDSTAVEIRLTDYTMLGHVPRERSAEFFAQVRAGHVVFAQIRSARGTAPRITIEAEVVFSDSVQPLPPREASPPLAPRLQSPVAPPGRTTSPSQPSKSQPSPLPPAAESSARWLWWVVGAILLLWLLAK